MKKRYVVLCILLLIIFTGCHRNVDQELTDIEQAVSNLYAANYDYKETREYFDGPTKDTLEKVVEGQRYHDPYKEHVQYISSNGKGNNLADEIYYKEKGNKITAFISTQDGWITQTIKQTSLFETGQPFGYGEDLKYSFDREETIDGKVVNVYKTKYKKELPKEYNLEEDLTALITQEYFLDQENKAIIKIVTDLSDWNKIIAIANDMSVNGRSFEDAKKNSEQIIQSTELVTLKIYNYGNPTRFEFPEIT